MQCVVLCRFARFFHLLAVNYVQESDYYFFAGKKVINLMASKSPFHTLVQSYMGERKYLVPWSNLRTNCIAGLIFIRYDSGTFIVFFTSLVG
jgi:hypothetical protein